MSILTNSIHSLINFTSIHLNFSNLLLTRIHQFIIKFYRKQTNVKTFLTKLDPHFFQSTFRSIRLIIVRFTISTFIPVSTIDPPKLTLPRTLFDKNASRSPPPPLPVKIARLKSVWPRGEEGYELVEEEKRKGKKRERGRACFSF